MKKKVLFATTAMVVSFVSCSSSGSVESASLTDSIPAVILEEIEAVIPDLENDSTILEEVELFEQ